MPDIEPRKRPDQLSEHAPEAAPDSPHAEARRNEQLQILEERSEGTRIEGIALDKPPEAQPELSTRLNASLTLEAIPQLLNAGLNPDLLRNVFEEPDALAETKAKAEQKDRKKFAKWDSSSQAAFAKLLEAARNPESLFSTGWKLTYQTLLARALVQYEEAAALRDTPKSAWEKTKAIGNDTIDYVKNNPYKTALIVGGAITVGFLVKNLISSFRSKTPEPQQQQQGQAAPAQAPKEQSLIRKGLTWILGGGAVVGTLIVLSKILPIEDAWKWFKDKFEDSKKEKTDKKLYKAAAEKIGIDDHEILGLLAEAEYEEFMSTTGEWKSWAAGKLTQTAIDALPDFAKKMIAKYKKSPQQILEAEEKLRKYLQAKQIVIVKIEPKRYVKEVLEGLARNGDFGNEFKNKPMEVSENDIPLAVQMDISNYGDRQIQNEVTEIAYRAFAQRVRGEQHKAIHDPKGLLARLEHMGLKDPKYKKKAEEVQHAFHELEQKRGAIHEAIKQKMPPERIRATALAEYEKAEKEFKELTTEFYAETEPHLPYWAAIPFFVRRYALLGNKKKAIVREGLYEVVRTPQTVVRELSEMADPVGTAQKSLKQAKDELESWEKVNGKNSSGRDTIKKTPGTELEWKAKISKVDFMGKKLTFEQKRAGLKTIAGLSEAQKAAYHAEILRLEKEYLEAYQEYFASTIQHRKSFFEKKGGPFDQEKVRQYREITGEKRRLRDAIKEHHVRISEAVKRLGENSPEAIKLVENMNAMTETYRQTVRNELSLFNSLHGRLGLRSQDADKGLREAYLEWAREEKESKFVKIAKSKWGRIGVMGAFLIPALASEWKTAKEKNPEADLWELKEELGLSALQLLVDVCPFTFGASDWYTVATGEEIITKTKLGGWDRYSRILWGTFGALLDAATIIPGVDVVGAPVNGIMRVARAAGKINEGKKIIKMWPRIKQVAESMGGWKKFAEALKNFKAAPGAMPKLAHAAEMVKIAAPRIVLAGVTYNVVYSLCDDANDKGIEMDPSLVSEIESEAKPPTTAA